jgi:hypothetical protein
MRVNIFVLCTGRSGSMTFAKACSHITNYTSAHESRFNLVGDDRLDYPSGHIEADNRLSWMLGSLERKYGKQAFYVHLTRESELVAASYLERWNDESSLMKAFWSGIVPSHPKPSIVVARQMVEVVTDNIALFLKDKPNFMQIRIEDGFSAFPEFWSRIGAEGDLKQALKEWEVRYNKRDHMAAPPVERKYAVENLADKLWDEKQFDDAVALYEIAFHRYASWKTIWRLSTCYFRGKGVPRNVQRAWEISSHPSVDRSASILYLRGQILSDPEFSGFSREKALEALELASKYGSELARKEIERRENEMVGGAS